MVVFEMEFGEVLMFETASDDAVALEKASEDSGMFEVEW